jgi:hypothetical protein
MRIRCALLCRAVGARVAMCRKRLDTLQTALHEATERCDANASADEEHRTI